jgi:glutamate formiminotransferase/formiminotetrahydrofolate cyclodeaminase
MADPARRPDFCGAWDERAARCGASVVGARNFLIAVNFNLDTKDAGLATEVAKDVREKGRKLPDGSWQRGPLKGCKAIGWYIEEYGIAQVSMNVTDIAATPLHVAYETVCRAAAARGLRVTGTEIIGLVPRQVLLDAGRYFSKGKDAGEEELVQAAIRGMALDDLCPFDPKRKVIEYQL